MEVPNPEEDDLGVGITPSPPRRLIYLTGYVTLEVTHIISALLSK